MMNEPLHDNKISDKPADACPPPDVDQQVDAIAATLEYLVEGYPQVGLRAMRAGQPTFSGCFNNLLEAAKQAAVLDLHGCGVYFGLNSTALFTAPWTGRVNLMGHGPALGDEHIIGRRLLLIDADPVRPAGVCSTEPEKAAAHAAAAGVVDYLHHHGWPEPVVADSGNGAHLLFRIDLPADDGGLVQRVLQAIDAKFTTSAVKFDTTVGNASRICRLYGTHNRKGPNTKQRPHRLAGILTAPTELAIVTRELLEELAASAPVQSPRTLPSRDLVRVMAAPKALLEAPQAARAEVINRARAQLHTLPIAVQGENGSKRCFRAACLLMVDCGLTIQEAFPLLKKYSERCQPPWSDEELLHKLEDAAKIALQHPETVELLAVPEAKEKKRKSILEKVLDADLTPRMEPVLKLELGLSQRQPASFAEA